MREKKCSKGNGTPRRPVTTRVHRSTVGTKSVDQTQSLRWKLAGHKRCQLKVPTEEAQGPNWGGEVPTEERSKKGQFVVLG